MDKLKKEGWWSATLFSVKSVYKQRNGYDAEARDDSLVTNRLRRRPELLSLIWVANSNTSVSGIHVESNQPAAAAAASAPCQMLNPAAATTCPCKTPSWPNKECADFGKSRRLLLLLVPFSQSLTSRVTLDIPHARVFST